MEMRGIEPRAFHMQSERSTTELHPLHTIDTENQTCTDTNLLLPMPSLTQTDHSWPVSSQTSLIQYQLILSSSQIFTIFLVYGHIMLKTPVLVRSLKLSNIEPC